MKFKKHEYLDQFVQNRQEKKKEKNLKESNTASDLH